MEQTVQYVDDNNFIVITPQPDLQQNYSFDYIVERKQQLQTAIDAATAEMKNLDDLKSQADVVIASVKASQNTVTQDPNQVVSN